MATVVITGTSSGIGRACAVRMARAGFRVFAGVRQESDADPLRAESTNVVPLEIDVTRADTIEAARTLVEVELGEGGLDGLVNNAGVGTAIPMEYASVDLMRHQFEVNVFGQLAVTQAFLPRLRIARGRIVNMGSVGGRITIPFGGVLCACKSALHAMNDALRLELAPFGVQVCLIEPGAILTPAVEKTLGHVEATIQALPPEGAARYADTLREFTRRAYEREKHGSPPEVVAEAVHHALTAAHPHLRYPVGRNAHLLGLMPRVLPDRLLDRIRRQIFHLPQPASQGSP